MPSRPTFTAICPEWMSTLSILSLLYLLNQLTDLRQIFTEFKQYLFSKYRTHRKLLRQKNKMAANLTYLIVFAISFEPIDRFTSDFYQIEFMYVFYA